MSGVMATSLVDWTAQHPSMDPVIFFLPQNTGFALDLSAVISGDQFPLSLVFQILVNFNSL